MPNDSFSDLRRQREAQEAAERRSKADAEKKARYRSERLKNGVKQYGNTVRSVLSELRDAWYPKAKVIAPVVPDWRDILAPAGRENWMEWRIGEYYPADNDESGTWGPGYSNLVSVILEFDEGLDPIGFRCTRPGYGRTDTTHAGLSRSELVAALRQLHAADPEAQRRP